MGHLIAAATGLDHPPGGGSIAHADVRRAIMHSRLCVVAQKTCHKCPLTIPVTLVLVHLKFFKRPESQEERPYAARMLNRFATRSDPGTSVALILALSD